MERRCSLFAAEHGTTRHPESPVFAGPLLPRRRKPWWLAVVLTVGTASVRFADGNNAAFTYTNEGTTQTKLITRQVFSGPGTVCQ